ncbi:MAG: thiamine-phosphate diphosphorylase [Bdellovibrionales bacterium RIFCSPHIGHO2_01_FULL_40_29]|nr:MAG: thiamine-phosphate diphosphorylase [Bdellovibrionales bacterium RIFCSPHIGHO2_01_FULL_40_29]OFZ33448.1 MAG: thiamine-phosphate diphosphorylase [Bdellovibrionales bacterium RIFCSPHIGHO2_02_FULL_40_15]
MKRFSDWSLYLVTDRKLCGERSLEDIILSAVQGGVSVVQLREKHLTSREYVELGKNVLKILRPFEVPLIINDRLDIALAIGADGVHLGQSDIHIADARKIMGPRALIGVSVETIAHAFEAEDWDVDYIAVSPVFPTQTKTDLTSPWGLEGLKAVREISKHPIVAIGGVHLDNIKDVLNAGADGVAIVSAIILASSPKQMAINLKTIIGDHCAIK